MKEYNLVDLEEKDLPALKKIATTMETPRGGDRRIHQA